METTETTRIIDAPAVAAVVAHVGLARLFELAIERVEAVSTAEAAGVVQQKERDGFRFTTPFPGLLEWMSAVRHGSTVSVKAVGYNPHNPAKNALPTILSTVLAFDYDSGHLRTVIDGTFTTALRTGAASAVASRALADPGSRVLGLVGCGAQAVTQLHALSRVFRFDEVLVSDVNPAAENSFASRARMRPGLVRSVPLAELEAQADVICTATSVAPGDGPVIRGERLKPAVHLNCVGSDMPDKTELPRELLDRVTVCPDHHVQASKEGECQRLSADAIGPSISTVLGDPRRYAGLRAERTVYDSTGLAIQDLAMVELFDELAHELGIGSLIRVEANSGDPYDPYAFLPADVTSGFGA
ncbi:ornithine cyclodeaminase family protein [Streptomyces sp. NPDC023838]|uniref:ornithine cyclodeaminase family protein n=1 Tax=Streptomyces sp. NPDC023838 TaxID=3154325 RepID=UPI0033E0BBA6